MACAAVAAENEGDMASIQTALAWLTCLTCSPARDAQQTGVNNDTLALELLNCGLIEAFPAN